MVTIVAAFFALENAAFAAACPHADLFASNARRPHAARALNSGACAPVAQSPPSNAFKKRRPHRCGEKAERQLASVAEPARKAAINVFPHE